MNIKLRKECLGMGLIGWIVAIPALLVGLVVLIFILCEINKAYWDNRVTKMCKEDGGATVFEIINISQDEYKKLGGINGAIPIPSERTKKDNDPYFAKRKKQYLNEGNPKVIKRITEIIRRDDKKVLGILTSYSRIGGDIPTGIAHPSSFSCRNVEGVSLDIEKQIFIVNGGVG